MSKFRVAVSADFLRPDGRPSFADFDLTPLKADPRIEIGYAAAEDDVMPAAALQDYDALILFGTRCGAPAFRTTGASKSWCVWCRI